MVGAGVIGLSCAVRLAEAGFQVDVLARDLPLETTSAVAGGLIMPVMAGPAGKVAGWTRLGLAHFRSLAASEDSAKSGVQEAEGLLLYRRRRPVPGWSVPLTDAVTLTATSRPAPGYGFGYRTRLPLIDPPRYLSYLRTRLEAADATLTRLSLTALPQRGLVVNATGVASRSLAGDPDVGPTRGQVARLGNPGLSGWWVDDDAEAPLTYILAREHDVIVGGTQQVGDWSTTADPVAAEAMLDRAYAVVPQLRGAEVLGHRVGLRPTRATVRLEVEPRPQHEDRRHAVVHCYGHGGCGITLSWGCAGDVVDLVQDLPV